MLPRLEIKVAGLALEMLKKALDAFARVDISRGGRGEAGPPLDDQFRRSFASSSPS